MQNTPLLAALSLVTLIVVLGYGFFHLRKVRRSQAKRGEAPGGMAGPSSTDLNG